MFKRGSIGQGSFNGHCRLTTHSSRPLLRSVGLILASGRMTVSQSQATEIARDFIRANQRPGDWPASHTPSSVNLDRGGFPSEFLGLGKEYWSLVFSLELPSDIVMTPDFVIVLVDVQTGKPAWFPVM